MAKNLLLNILNNLLNIAQILLLILLCKTQRIALSTDDDFCTAYLCGYYVIIQEASFRYDATLD